MMKDNRMQVKTKKPLHERVLSASNVCDCRRIAMLLLSILLAVTLLCGFSSGAVPEGARVFDGAGLFTDDEEQRLEQLCRETIEENRLDIVIVTTEDTDGSDAMDYADDFYDENGFGYEDDTGILLLIDMGEREIWISTAGKAIDYFTDDRLDDMIDIITMNLSSGEYAEGAQSFVEQCAVYMYNDAFEDDEDWDEAWGEEWNDAEYINENGSSGSTLSHRISTSLLIALVIGAVMVIMLYMQQKNGRATDAHTYLKNGSFAVADRRDIYTHTTTVKHHIDTDNDSHKSGSHHSSHSSTHHSRSGASHGGRGGKF